MGRKQMLPCCPLFLLRPISHKKSVARSTVNRADLLVTSVVQVLQEQRETFRKLGVVRHGSQLLSMIWTETEIIEMIHGGAELRPTG